ncbi:TrmH family RNA methyltransferase [Brevundimonas viscosa]|uniref:tRNA G18 (Ribose-2'-O)-methylase SpoU n=1 Tax=Brevundimonas viscosa TaxID=871741 RepID=A0A1I6PYT6_9CAUL|nr:RNA methyltransferase [Brevundimonas viscosa]SFS45230.1 tRNA G18 (ribose-2'-O)-methylase SpoU [Brevundimonas viscosa]
MNIIRIEAPDDPRTAAFRDIRERDLTGREGQFIAEGEVVLRQLVSAASRCRPAAVLLAENRLGGLADVLALSPPAMPVYVAPQAVLDGIAGFHLHRGILALGRKPDVAALPDVLAGLPRTALVVLACGIGNHDNIGGIFRNAAAFGADAVLLDRQCCDPFYRKAIRVSVGAVLRTPMVVGLDATAAVEALKAAGFAVLAMTPSAELTLDAVPPAARIAVVLGAEGPGLPADLIARCTPVGIRMSGGFDSLNVGTAGAIALHHFARRA